MEMMVVNFLAPHHPHWCRVPQLEHLPSDFQRAAAIPWDFEKDTYSSCRMYDLPSENFTYVAEMYQENNVPGLEDYFDLIGTDNISSTSCSKGSTFDYSQFHRTVISEWNLVCDSETILELISPVFTVGLFVGSLVGGIISDRLGRMTSLLTFTVFHLLAGVAASFSPNVYVFIVCRFFIALCIRGAGISGAVLLMESLTSRFRVAAMVGYQMFLGLGIVAISALAMLLRDFRELQLAIVVPLICMVAYKWLLTESPVWLTSKNQTENAIKAVQKMANKNGKLIPNKDLESFKNQMIMKTENDTDQNKEGEKSKAAESSLSFVDLFKNTVLRRYTIISYFTMSTCIFIDLGVALNLGSLFGDVYTNSFLTGSSEMAANFLVYFAIQFLGRRASMLICFFGIISTESLSVVMQIIDHQFVSSIMSILSRCFASSGYLTLSIYVAELFPTSVRQGALGSSNAIAAAVGIAAPLVGGSLHEVWFPLPNIIFGSMALICIPMCLLLPETKGQGMPQTLSRSVDLLKKGSKENIGKAKEYEEEDHDTTKDRRPTRHLHDLERGVFDDDGNLLYTENAILGDFSFSNVVRLEGELQRPSGVYRIPMIMHPPPTNATENNIISTHL